VTLELTDAPKGGKNDPIVKVGWVHCDELHANHWNPNRVFKLELELLERSLLSTGWIQPLLVGATGQIIDGFHRWRLSQDSPSVEQRYKRMVPVAVIDCDEPTAMAMTVRINRAKGSHSAVSMSELAHAIVNDYGWTREHLAAEIGAHIDEVDLLLQENVFTLKKVHHWAYTEAWYPTPSGQDSIKEEPTTGGYGNTGVTDMKEAIREGLIPAND